MAVKPEFYASQRLKFRLVNGHMTCTCKALNYLTSTVVEIKFIHDTGAFISTLNILKPTRQAFI